MHVLVARVKLGVLCEFLSCVRVDILCNNNNTLFCSI